jgi:phosphoglycerol transferase MdoB-like AlkP superfamily enzyme
MDKWYQHLFVLLKKIGLLLFIYGVCRLLFYLFNFSHFSDINFTELIYLFVVSIKFDLSVIILLNSLFIILWLLPIPFREKSYYQTSLKWLFIIPNSIGFLANCVDLAYFQFTLKRTTADVFNFFGGEIGNDLGHLLPVFLVDYWYVFIIWGILTAILIRFYGKKEQKAAIWTKKEFGIQFLVFAIAIAVSVLLYRGGLQLKPINAVDAAQYTSSKNVPFIISTPFSILKTLDLESIEPHTYFENEKEIESIYMPIQFAKKADFQKSNVVLIILESFSKEYIGAINHRQKGFTPFLDSLIQQSLVFTNAYSNGKKSIEGLPSIVASIPTWMNEAYITSPYGSNLSNSIASLLKQEGYTSSFYHGGTNGTMGFDAFSHLVGYDNYFGRTEYNNEKDYDGNWGIWDEEYLQYYAKNINQQKQPFFSTIFTLSSHHPFEIPKKYAGKFKTGDLPILQSVAYTDYALKRFFETAKQMPWFNNTLFVICADHTGISGDHFYGNQLGSHAIPIIYFKQNSTLKGIDSTVTQQLDIMPSILDYLNYPHTYFAFGKSVFDTTQSAGALTFNSNFYQYIEKEYVLQFDGNSSIGLFNHTKDSTLQNNLMVKEPALLKQMEQQIKARIQTYEQRLINNKMTTN